MPTNPLDAEAYELPQLSQAATSPAKSYFGDSVAEEEGVKLLNTEAQPKRDDESELVDDPALYMRRTQDEEVIGRGSKVEELIARVIYAQPLNTSRAN